MMNISQAFKNNRLLKSLTGVHIEEFNQLLSQFEPLLYAKQRSKRRQRAVGAGRKGALSNYKKKLFFILFYLKVYPTFDLASFFFEVDRSGPCRWVQNLLPLLEEVLGRACVLPRRKIATMEEFLKYFPEAKDLLIDGTERPTQRPSGKRNKQRRYSGKKGSHKRKTLLGTTEQREILLLSATKNGRRHDKYRLDQTGWLSAIPPEVTLWVDTGFMGVEANGHTRVERPVKRSKNKPLSSTQKQLNQLIARVRIRVEHAIAGLKRFQSTTQIYRNRKGQDDQFMLLAAGLWNFHLKYN